MRHRQSEPRGKESVCVLHQLSLWTEGWEKLLGWQPEMAGNGWLREPVGQTTEQICAQAPVT